MKDLEVQRLAADGFFRGKRVDGKLEETHISWVIFAGKVAFKIKKPLKLSFVDASTVQKRHRLCQKEIVLNSRFSNIYQGVIAIRRASSGYFFGGNKGRIVEYAVKMQRMAASKRLDKALQRGVVRREHMAVLARVVSSCHRRCPVVSTPFSLKGARSLFRDVLTVEKFVARHVAAGYTGVIRKSVRWSDRFLKRHETRLRERVAGGFIRDIHGDLHSGNIFLYREPVIFDCIEFNDAFRRIDVLYEVAFLCMDLEAFEKPGLSDAFFSSYAGSFKCIETQEDVAIFQYYKCLRANVRAKVHAISALQSGNGRDFQLHLAAVEKYLDLIRRYIS